MNDVPTKSSTSSEDFDDFFKNENIIKSEQPTVQLNEQQKQAVEHFNGPCVVVATAGAGKTKVLTERVIHLIQQKNIPSKNILCFTFTNKAANEMKKRICARLNQEKLDFYVGTFHALCVAILKTFGKSLGFNSINIIDDGEQRELIDKIIRQKGYSKKDDGIDSYSLASTLNSGREEMKTEQEIIDDINRDMLKEIAEEYFKQLLDTNSFDFSALLYQTVRLLNFDNYVLEKLQGKFKYILVDEMQDINTIQYHLIKMLGGTTRNIFFVGDVSQCVPTGTMISGSKRRVPVELVKKGSETLSAIGEAKIGSNIVINTYSKYVEDYDVLTLKTKQGFSLTITPEHLVPSDYIKYNDVLCLVYKNDEGYKLSEYTQDYDKLWYIGKLDEINIFAQKYNLGKIFYSQNADQLFHDTGIDKNYPNLISPHKTINITQCIRNHEHYCRVILNKHDFKKLKDFNYKEENKNECSYSFYTEHISEIQKVKTKIDKTIKDVQIFQKCDYAKYSFPLIPAGNILPGMKVFIKSGVNGVSIDEVKEVKKSKYTGNVYDLDVEYVHNFIANNIVVHNSIYKFRGARYELLNDFINENPDCVKLQLGKNYRCTKNIVKVADKLIKHNSSHMLDKMETDNEEGAPVELKSYYEPFAEATAIAEKIQSYVKQGIKYSDIAILYRLNKLSMELEIVLSKHNIPYDVKGSFSFFDRREIKDCVAMLKMGNNKNDVMSYSRIMGLIPKIGDKNIGMIENLAKEHNCTVLDICKDMAKYSTKKAVIDGATKFYDIYANKVFKNPGNSLAYLLEKFDYRKHIELHAKTEEEKQERLENVEEFLVSCSEAGNEGQNLSNYLINLALVQNKEKEQDPNRVVLQSVHAAKGLEYDIVFSVGQEHSILPCFMSFSNITDPKELVENLEEETRCAFVMLTRAKKKLHVSWCENRKKRMGPKLVMIKSKPSQFLYESGLLDDKYANKSYFIKRK